MTAGDSKAAMTITRPALASSPHPRPAPTSRALTSKPDAQRGQNWKPIRGQFWAPIDTIQRRGVRVTVVSTISTQPAWVADELRRQADLFLDLRELQPRIARDPVERPL